jgi:hypothetical protein
LQIAVVSGHDLSKNYYPQAIHLDKGEIACVADPLIDILGFDSHEGEYETLIKSI